MYRRFIALAGSSLVFAGIAAYRPAAADDMTWTVTSHYRYRVQLQLYSQNRNHSWPGGDQVWGLNDSAPHRFSIECRTGEKICYGAWVTGEGARYWGTGAGNKHDCEDCCAVCGDSDPVKELVR